MIRNRGLTLLPQTSCVLHIFLQNRCSRLCKIIIFALRPCPFPKVGLQKPPCCRIIHFGRNHFLENYCDWHMQLHCPGFVFSIGFCICFWKWPKQQRHPFKVAFSTFCDRQKRSKVYQFRFCDSVPFQNGRDASAGLLCFENRCSLLCFTRVTAMSTSCFLKTYAFT